MAEDILEIAIHKAGFAETNPIAIGCKTKDLPIHGYKKETDFNEPLYYYGTDKEEIQLIIQNDKSSGEQIHPLLPFIKAEITWAVRHEMCMTVEDALSRRTRALLLDAKSAIESAPVVAEIMAKEMQKTGVWIQEQIVSFNSVAKNYLPD